MWHLEAALLEEFDLHDGFTRELTKIFFTQADASEDAEAGALAAQPTPRRPDEFKPQSVLEVINALADRCVLLPLVCRRDAVSVHTHCSHTPHAVLCARVRCARTQLRRRAFVWRAL